MKTASLAETEKALDELTKKIDAMLKPTEADHGGPEPAVSLRRILVPTDFSNCAREALEFAVPFARQFGATLLILHVIPPYYEGDVNPYGVNPCPVEATERDSTEQLLDHVVAETVPVDVFSKTLVRNGAPAGEIVRAAREFKADLIVISTHGYTGLKHALFGSTAENVVRQAPCPVLTVRARQPNAEQK